MAEYQKVEYKIGKDGKITERVLDATGSSCTETTSSIEKALGEISDRELLPEYFEDESILTRTETQSLNQK